MINKGQACQQSTTTKIKRNLQAQATIVGIPNYHCAEITENFHPNPDLDHYQDGHKEILGKGQDQDQSHNLGHHHLEQAKYITTDRGQSHTKAENNLKNPGPIQNQVWDQNQTGTCPLEKTVPIHPLLHTHENM